MCHDQAGQVLQGPSICYERGRGAWRPIRQWQNRYPPHPVTPRKQREQRVMKAPSSQKGQESNPGGCFLIVYMVPDINKVLTTCGGLASRVSLGTSTVVLRHHSFRQLLTTTQGWLGLCGGVKSQTSTTSNNYSDKLLILGTSMTLIAK